MTKFERLIKEAKDACNFRGHKMFRFTRWVGNTDYRQTATSHCRDCGKFVAVDTKPAPNGIEIAGEAVALKCKKK